MKIFQVWVRDSKYQEINKHTQRFPTTSALNLLLRICLTWTMAGWGDHAVQLSPSKLKLFYKLLSFPTEPALLSAAPHQQRLTKTSQNSQKGLLFPSSLSISLPRFIYLFSHFPAKLICARSLSQPPADTGNGVRVLTYCFETRFPEILWACSMPPPRLLFSLCLFLFGEWRGASINVKGAALQRNPRVAYPSPRRNCLVHW